VLMGYEAQAWTARNVHDKRLIGDRCCERKTIPCPHCLHWNTDICLSCINYVSCADLNTFDQRVKEYHEVDFDKRKVAGNRL
jgi:hypothetical protein